MNATNKPIRVLIVEDSPAYRELLTAILQQDPGFQVVGTARDGAEGVRLAKRLQPDIITMDVHMPIMDGYEATRQIMQTMPRPIVMISGSINKSEHDLTFDALQVGALGIVDKPTLQDPPEIHQRLTSHLRLMSEVRVVRRWGEKGKKSAAPPAPVRVPRNGRSPVRVVAIAASTGGPGALVNVLSRLPATFPAPVLIVQHVTTGFGEGLASWLNGQVPLPVRVARHADELAAGEVLVAPDNYHMTVNRLGLIALSKAPAIHGLRPAADFLFRSVADVYGKTAVGIILTGMGSDGANGLLAMHRAGAYTIAQDEKSCVVFGMPAVAIERQAVETVQPLNRIADVVMKLVAE